MNIITNLKSPILSLSLLYAIMVPSSTMANHCDKNLFQKSAWGLSSGQSKIFLSDATLSKNRSLSDGEIEDRLRDDITKTYKAHRVGEGPFVKPGSLAAKIKWAASCTGHDFSMLAAVLKTESTYCSSLHNKGGGDSGCGQFTSASIGFFKNQLRLPGRSENGSSRMKSTIEELMGRCASGSSYVNEDSLAKLFAKSKDEIRQELRTGKNISLDVLATAIFLKFYYSISGFYYDANTSAPGALSRYNGGGHEGYGELANSRALKIDLQVCEKDLNYLRKIEINACELSDDKDVCSMTIPYIDV